MSSKKQGAPPQLKPWQKGKSGNPHGRPRGSRNAATVVKGLLDAEIDYNTLLPEQRAFMQSLLKGENKATVRELAIIHQVYRAVIKSDLRSLEFVLGLAREGPEHDLPIISEDAKGDEPKFTDEEAIRILEGSVLRRRIKDTPH